MTSELHVPDEVQRMLSVLGPRARANLSFHDLDKIRRILNPPLEYSPEPPAEPGWYWLEGEDDPIELWLDESSPNDPELRALLCDIAGNERAFRVSELHARLAGPIPRPVAPSSPNTWMTEPPSVAGRYLVEGEDEPVEVFNTCWPNGKYGLAVIRYNEHGDERLCRPAEVQLRWAGPLSEPQE